VAWVGSRAKGLASRGGRRGGGGGRTRETRKAREEDSRRPGKIVDKGLKSWLPLSLLRKILRLPAPAFSFALYILPFAPSQPRNAPACFFFALPIPASRNTACQSSAELLRSVGELILRRRLLSGLTFFKGK
jgi:hypothetical protein